MLKIIKVVLLTVMISLLSCKSERAEIYSLAPGSPLALSMVSLLTSPGDYLNRNIEVRGYLGKFPNLAIYLSKEHYDIGDHMSSIGVVNLTYKETAISEYCGDKYAIVQGQILPDQQGIPRIGKLVRIMVFNEGKLELCWPEGS